nr:hypothetical protein [Tanacetum cinerariifolium]
MVKSSSSSENKPCCSKSCKKNTDSINSKITDLEDKLFDAKNMIYHYKLGLAQVESILVEHKDREIKYCKKIRGLEFKNESSDEYIEILKKELELIKKEKESVEIMFEVLFDLILTQRNGTELLLIQIYVDDIIFAASSLELCDLFANLMCSKFKMSMMGKISFFLGLQISQSPRGIFINQSKYSLKSLKKYGFESCDPVDTLMVEKSKLDEDKEGKAIDPSHYHGSSYRKARTCSQKDFRYIRGTVHWGLRYPKDSSIALTAFADADHAGCQDTRRSTSGSV